MSKLIKTEIKIMDRSIWFETKETDLDIGFLKREIEYLLIKMASAYNPPPDSNNNLE